MNIEDGKGTGYKGRVDRNNRIHTQSVQESEALHAAELGDGYNINTGDVTFTAAGTLAYFKNDQIEDFVVEALAIGIGTGAVSEIGTLTLVRNPTGGDLITDATAVDMNANRNFGSNQTLEATTLAYKGKSGGTITGGADIAQFYQGTNGRLFATINFILPKGASLGIRYNPNLSSGNVVAYCAVIGFLKDPESKD